MSNVAWEDGRCLGDGVTLEDAQTQCTGRSDCSVLHDYNCDGRLWRACTLGLTDLFEVVAGAGLVGDTLACTLVYRCATATAPQRRKYGRGVAAAVAPAG